MILNTRKMWNVRVKINDVLEQIQKVFFQFEVLVEMGKIDRDDGSKFLGDELISLTKEQLMDNPYLKDIKIPNVQCGNICLSKKRIIKPDTVTVFEEKTMDLESFLPISKYFVCDKALRFPAISENEDSVAWMTVEPREINSFDKFINEAYGDVLLIGCGLGYVAYMLSLKEEVKSVTIVDIDSDVLSVFNQYILPQFENKDKIKTILGDGMKYLDSTDLSCFDHVNVDIWRSTNDMIFYYLPCLEIESRYPNVKFSYWVEECLKECLQKNILTVIGNINGDLEGDAIYFNIAEDIVRVIEIGNINDIKNIIRLDNLREILYDWYINNKELFDKLSGVEKVKLAKLERQIKRVKSYSSPIDDV